MHVSWAHAFFVIGHTVWCNNVKSLTYGDAHTNLLMCKTYILIVYCNELCEKKAILRQKCTKAMNMYRCCYNIKKKTNLESWIQNLALCVFFSFLSLKKFEPVSLWKVIFSVLFDGPIAIASLHGT